VAACRHWAILIDNALPADTSGKLFGGVLPNLNKPAVTGSARSIVEQATQSASITEPSPATVSIRQSAEYGPAIEQKTSRE
jgi:hypothetical protein